MSVLAICPSRGRPQAAAAVLQSFLATRTDPASRLAFIVDHDDPTRAEYPETATFVLRSRGTMGAALDQAVRNRHVMRDATSVGMIGDDNRFLTLGWDEVIDETLRQHPGIVYGDDLFQHERLPTSWWLSRKVVEVFGLAPTWLRHFYMDNYWLELGTAAGCIQYLPDVVIEHLHPLAGKAPQDPTYERSGRWAPQDRRAFHLWLRARKQADAKRLKALVRPAAGGAVLADWHHPALWESLSILFEDRFGMALYSPIGLHWRKYGWRLDTQGTPGWRMADYLVHDDAINRGTHWERTPPEYPTRPHKMVSRRQAGEIDWSIVLSSVAIHQSAFAKLAERLGARAVHQIGNAHHRIDPHVRQTIIASANVPEAAVVYHQEFDQNLFYYTEPSPAAQNRVTSFMLRLETASCPHEWLSELPTVVWKAYGGSRPGDPEYLTPMDAVARAYHDTGWVWHDKRIGDGYGHALWNAAAVGRPLIGHASHYTGLQGEALWEDGITCIDLDQHTHEEALQLMQDTDLWRAMSEMIRNRFERLVDFDKEALALRRVLL